MKCLLLILFVSLCACDELVLYQNLEESMKNDSSKDISRCIIKVLSTTIKNRENYKSVVLVNVDDNTGKEIYKVEGFKFASITQAFDINTTPKDVYIIITDDRKSFTDNIAFVKRDLYWNPRGVFIIVLNKTRKLKLMADLLLKNNMFNVTIIMRNLEGKHEMYTFGSELDNCNIPQNLELISHCPITEEVHYPKIMPQQLSQCRVKMVSHNYWPYFSINLDIVGLSGEGYLLDILNKTEGIKVEIVAHLPDEDFGKVLDNYTFTGMLRKFQTYEVEGAIGGYYLNENRNKYFDYTYPFMVDHIRIIVPEARHLEVWEAVYKQITLNTLFVIMFFFLLFCFVITRMAIFRRYRKDVIRELLVVYGYFLCNIIRTPVENILSKRLVVVNLLVFVFLLNCIIQASILSVTTNPVKGPQETDIQTVMEEYQPIVATRYADKLPFKTPWICDSVADCLKRVKKSKDLHVYTITSDITFEHAVWKTLDEDYTVGLFKIPLAAAMMLQTILFRRGSPFLEKFQKVIIGLQNGGLLKRHFKLMQFRYMITRNNTNYNNYALDVLDFGDFKESFAILIVGHIVAIIAFVTELFIRRNRRRNIP